MSEWSWSSRPPIRHVLRPTKFIDMVQWVLRWEGQKRCSGSKWQGLMVGKCCINKFWMICFFGGRECEDKRRQTDDRNCYVFCSFFLFKLLFMGIFKKKISTHSLFGAWSFLLIHIGFTPCEGPKGFVNWFLKKLNHGSWTVKLDHGKRSSSMVHGVNWPYLVTSYDLSISILFVILWYT